MGLNPSAAGESPAVMRHHAPLPTLALPQAGGGRGVLGFCPGGDPLPSVLAHTLETRIIPRLALAHRAPTPGAAGAVPTADEVEELTALVMQADVAASLELVARLRAREVPLAAILLDLLAPVARRLGELWLADACDFSTVTIGVCCLQQVVMQQRDDAAARAAAPQAERRVLLAPLPGEQHGFGLLLVGEFFRRQGWEVCGASGASARELTAMVRRQYFGIVGLSLADEDRTGDLATLIHDIRRSSRNRRLGVMVGGQCFTDRPELSALVGADATASDAQQAVLTAETLLALLLQDP
jgi:methanogenic corrinoid protein MtbC1